MGSLVFLSVRTHSTSDAVFETGLFGLLGVKNKAKKIMLVEPD